MKFYHCDDWSRLAGAQVEIRRYGRLVRSGVVDAVMPDATMLWLAADYNGTRALFESAEGYEVWVEASNMSAGFCSSVLRQQSPTDGKSCDQVYELVSDAREWQNDKIQWIPFNEEGLFFQEW